MEIQDILQWAIPVAIGIAVLIYMQRSLGKVGAAGQAKLARFGLRPEPDAGKGGSTFAGTYQGIRCGYHWGKTAHLLNRVGTDVGVLTAGSEFWATLGFDGPPLAIVERNDKGWKKFEGHVVPRAEVPTGHAAFDQRFRVRCDDPAWVQRVLRPGVCDALLAVPLLFLVQTDEKVIFPLYFDGQRLFEKFEVSMSVAWSLMDRTDVLLDAAIVLVEAMQQARQNA
jgi:hypothetical protein